MKLKKLLSKIPVALVKGSKEIEITGITAHSKQVAPGNLFIAKKGITQDGGRFIPDAIAAGAVAVVSDLYDPFLEKVVQIVHPDVAYLEEKLAEQFYEEAHQHLYLVGITGTNGKTTCSYLVKHLFDTLKLTCGLIGTIEWNSGRHALPATLTTPDLITNHKLFHEMVENGCKAAVMEVSSHALEQGRVRGIDFDVALFTNLTLDHLDYHKTMESYAASKAKLFQTLSQEKIAIVNKDSPWIETILKGCRASIITYGLDETADLRATEISLHPKGMQFYVHFREKKALFVSTLTGRFNVYNCLAVIGVGLARGFPLDLILEALQRFRRVPGRLEQVPNNRQLNIYVDYAHTDDALKNVLMTLREIKRGRIITLFGCGGNRDRSKRPKMAEVAEEYSDVTIVTTDNPRQEDPEAIIREILAGFRSPDKILIEPDRQLAIYKAVGMAKQGDIILIAGKGHETYQIFAHKTIDFDDRKVAQEACHDA